MAAHASQTKTWCRRGAGAVLALLLVSCTGEERDGSPEAARAPSSDAHLHLPDVLMAGTAQPAWVEAVERHEVVLTASEGSVSVAMTVADDVPRPPGTFPIVISAAADTTPGPTTVEIRLSSCPSPGCEEREVSVVVGELDVVAPTPQQVPDRLAVPADVREHEGRLVADNLLVAIVDPTDATARDELLALAEAEQLPIVGANESAGVFQFAVDAGSLEELAERADRLDAAVSATFTLEIATTGTGIPAAYDGLTWDAPGHERNWHWAMLEMPQVWEQTTGSPDVAVGVVDAGFDQNHPSIVPNLADARATFEVERSWWPWSSDDSPDVPPALDGPLRQHGTDVTATLCSPDLGAGSWGTGVMHECELHYFDWSVHPILASSKSEDARHPELADTGWNSSALAAASLAAASPARIINLSYNYLAWRECADFAASGHDQDAFDGRPGDAIDRSLARAYRDVLSRTGPNGVLPLWVAGVGNNCADLSAWAPWNLATELENLLVVTSVDADGRLSEFASWGDHVTLAAPGGYFIDEEGERAREGEDGHGVALAQENRDADDVRYNWGTSYATPMVAGVAGLLLSLDSELTAGELAKRLEDTALRQVRPPRTGGDSQATASDVSHIRIVDPVAAALCTTTGLDVPVAAQDAAAFVTQLLTTDGQPAPGGWAFTAAGPLVTEELGYRITRYDQVTDPLPYLGLSEDQIAVRTSPCAIEQHGADRLTFRVVTEIVSDKWPAPSVGDVSLDRRLVTVQREQGRWLVDEVHLEPDGERMFDVAVDAWPPAG